MWRYINMIMIIIIILIIQEAWHPRKNMTFNGHWMKFTLQIFCTRKRLYSLCNEYHNRNSIVVSWTVIFLAIYE